MAKRKKMIYLWGSFKMLGNFKLKFGREIELEYETLISDQINFIRLNLQDYLKITRRSRKPYKIFQKEKFEA